MTSTGTSRPPSRIGDLTYLVEYTRPETLPPCFIKKEKTLNLRSEAGIASILKGFANCAIEVAVDQAEELPTGCDDPFE